MREMMSTLEALGEEKFKWMQIARDQKHRVLRAEAKIGYLLKEIDELKSELRQFKHHRR